MKEHDNRCLLVNGPAQHNPAGLTSLGGTSPRGCDQETRPGRRALSRPDGTRRSSQDRAENDQLSKYPIQQLFKETHNNHVDAIAFCATKRCSPTWALAPAGCHLRQQRESAPCISVFTRLQQRMPGLQFQGFIQDEILLTAMMTKDADEIEHIRQNGQSHVSVVAALPTT